MLHSVYWSNATQKFVYDMDFRFTLVLGQTCLSGRLNHVALAEKKKMST